MSAKINTTTPTNVAKKYTTVTLYWKRTRKKTFSLTSVIFGGIGYYSEHNKTQFLTVVEANLDSITYFVKQCAAVMSHVLLTRVAPH